MEPPYPGPNLMLPALRLSDPPSLDSHLAYKKREAIFKKLVAAEHKKWCLCGAVKNHYLPHDLPLANKESCSEDGEEQPGEGAPTIQEATKDGLDIEDEDIIAAGDLG
nr:ORF2 [Torque teno felis virus]